MPMLRCWLPRALVIRRKVVRYGSGMRISYGRVSTRDQHPEAQEDAPGAAGCDMVVVDRASGKLARRPELERALLSANRAGDQLVVTKLDRLGRSLEHLIELSKLLDSRGVDLVVLDQGIDTSTPVGRMVFHILGAVAEFEHALLSERTRDGWQPRVLADAPAGRSPSSARGRSGSHAGCTTNSTSTGTGGTPWRRSPPSSASADRRSTGTLARKAKHAPSVSKPDACGAREARGGPAGNGVDVSAASVQRAETGSPSSRPGLSVRRAARGPRIWLTSRRSDAHAIARLAMIP